MSEIRDRAKKEIAKVLERHGVFDLEEEILSIKELAIVDRETIDYIKCPCDDCTAEHKLIDEWGYFCDITCGQRSHWITRCRERRDMLKAHFVKEVK